jgi:hypothetical protein
MSICYLFGTINRSIQPLKKQSKPSLDSRIDLASRGAYYYIINIGSLARGRDDGTWGIKFFDMAC